MILTYKYRIKDQRVKRILSAHANAVNFVWNYCAGTQRKVQKIWTNGQKISWPSHYNLQHLTKNTSKELGIHAQSIGSACNQFAKSRDQHKKCPKFRKNVGPRRALGWVPFQQQSRQITNNSITYLGKTYKFFGALKRPLPLNAKGGCFTEDSRGNWWVCFQVENNDKLLLGTKEVGIDLGLKTLVTTSAGEKFENPRNFAKLAAKLAKAQRANNRDRIKNIHIKIKNVRSDYLHKLSNKITKENKLIIVGNVSASKLAKTKMAKSVLDASWSALRGMFRYKASRRGASYAEVDESFTTQTCSRCGNSASLGRPKGIAGLGIRDWVCDNCGASHDRDVNAAINILNLGRSTTPLVGESRVER